MAALVGLSVERAARARSFLSGLSEVGAGGDPVAVGFTHEEGEEAEEEKEEAESKRLWRFDVWAK